MTSLWYVFVPSVIQELIASCKVRLVDYGTINICKNVFLCLILACRRDHCSGSGADDKCQIIDQHKRFLDSFSACLIHPLAQTLQLTFRKTDISFRQPVSACLENLTVCVSSCFCFSSSNAPNLPASLFSCVFETGAFCVSCKADMYLSLIHI